jgi:hypothetical protein
LTGQHFQRFGTEGDRLPKVSGETMPITPSRQSISTDVPPGYADHIARTAPLRLALVLLGLATLLIVIGAAYPEFFTGSLSQFGSQSP